MTIIEDDLLIYYHANRGFGNKWENISPNTAGRYNGVVVGATKRDNHIYFDGVDDRVDVSRLNQGDLRKIYEIEIYFSAPFDTGPATLMLFGSGALDIQSFTYLMGVISFSGDGSTVYSTGLTGIRHALSRNTTIKVNVVFNTVTNIEKIYINDILIKEIKLEGDAGIDYSLIDFSYHSTIGTTSIDVGRGLEYSTSYFKGSIYSFKMYGRELTQNEREKNSAVGYENVGLKVVTDGLVGYWNSKQGVNGSAWKNIAPATKSKYDGVISGATITEGGMYFDGVDDSVTMQTPNELLKVTDLTIEFKVKVGDRNKATYMEHLIIDFNNYHGISISNSYSERYDWTIETPEFSMSSNSPIEDEDSPVFVSLIYDSKKGDVIFCINGIIYQDNFSFGQIDMAQLFAENTFGINVSSSRFFYEYFEGVIDGIRLYNRQLTHKEIQQNYSVGSEVGLGLSEPTSPQIPNVNSISISNYKVSHVIEFDVSTLEFSFNEDITEWKVVLLGASHDTGTLLDSGNAVDANVNIFSVIYGEDMYQEGLNRVNIYGKNEAGWTEWIES